MNVHHNVCKRTKKLYNNIICVVSVLNKIVQQRTETYLLKYKDIIYTIGLIVNNFDNFYYLVASYRNQILFSVKTFFDLFILFYTTQFIHPIFTDTKLLFSEAMDLYMFIR